MHTLDAINWLYDQKRLSHTEKTLLCADIIQGISTRAYSEVELAYSLLILDTKPDETSFEGPPPDLANIPFRDVDDFEQFCHRIVVVAQAM